MTKMKHVLICICAFLWTSLSLTAQDMAVLDSIQYRIDEAMNLSFAMQKNKIEPIMNGLEEVAKSESDSEGWIAYWRAYGHYQEAIFHMAMEDNELAEAKNEKAMEILEEVDNMNSEHHVLLGSTYSLAISFSTVQAVILSARASKEYEKALKLNESNMRAHLAIGRSDYYKPVMWGGGKKVEPSMLKALSLPIRGMESQYAPTWGKDQAYIYIIRYYMREDRSADAKLYCQRGLNDFPTHYELNKLSEEI